MILAANPAAGSGHDRAVSRSDLKVTLRKAGPAHGCIDFLSQTER